jgi:hypothetical protein
MRRAFPALVAVVTVPLLAEIPSTLRQHTARTDVPPYLEISESRAHRSSDKKLITRYSGEVPRFSRGAVWQQISPVDPYDTLTEPLKSSSSTQEMRREPKPTVAATGDKVRNGSN